jgi:hypothetical protein
MEVQKLGDSVQKICKMSYYDIESTARTVMRAEFLPDQKRVKMPISLKI